MAETKKKPTAEAEKASPSADPVLANRETVESIVVAVILALMFRAFVAEAFVIPTGSMAPTLMGRHVDTWCNQCGFHFQVGGSAERDENDARKDVLVADGRCVNCGHRQTFDKSFFSNENSFSGDRIIVSKFAYELSAPKRWDVIVFKNPNRTQQNFIKRLIGLPGETLLISGGNIYTKRSGASDFSIARKEDDAKLLAMLQTVHDADHPAVALHKAGWPLRWQAHGSGESWKSNEQGSEYKLAATTDDALIRYHHFDPSDISPGNDGSSTWEQALAGESLDVDPDWQGRLISDFYSYNCERLFDIRDEDQTPFFNPEDGSAEYGQHWVDDLALECEVELSEATGEVVLDLVRAGVHYQCRIDAKTGEATLTSKQPPQQSSGLVEDHGEIAPVKASTSLKQAGTYRLRMSNVDHEVRLWIDGWRVKFDGATTYAAPRKTMPDVDSDDGDLAPIGVGGKNQDLTVRHLRVLRDKYYVANTSYEGEYDTFRLPDGKVLDFRDKVEIGGILGYPATDTISALMLARRDREFTPLADDQYMPLGDNSPASSDARFWSQSYVEQHLLIGKAIFIYWPHSWNMPPFMPNFRRMQPIR